MTAQRLAPGSLLLPGAAPSRSRSACTWSACTTARSAGWRPSSARCIAWRRRSGPRTSTGRATPRRCSASARPGMLVTYLVLRLQHVLPLNPEHLANVVDRQAFETSASFTTNTNWQSYAGETMMSYFSQMTQLAFHNFASAAVGMASAVALVRGIARRESAAGSATSGSISCAARSTCSSRSRSCSRCCSCSRA